MVDDPGRDAVRHRSLTLLRPSQEIKPLACRSAPNPNPDSHILPLRCPALGTTRIYRPCRRCFYLSGTGGSPNRRCCGHVTGRWLGRESPDRRLTATQDEYPARFSEWNKTHILTAVRLTEPFESPDFCKRCMVSLNWMEHFSEFLRGDACSLSSQRIVDRYGGDHRVRISCAEPVHGLRPALPGKPASIFLELPGSPNRRCCGHDGAVAWP